MNEDGQYSLLVVRRVKIDSQDTNLVDDVQHSGDIVIFW